MAVVKDAVSVGKLVGADILRVSEVDFLPFSNQPYYYDTDFKETMEIEKMERIQTDMKKWLETQFYFSLECDLTTRLQNGTLGKRPWNEQMWKSLDPRFHWNRKIQQYFLKYNLYDWVIPIMKGFVQMANTMINGKSVDLILISRMSCARAGARFIVRGVDDDGNVANFVETEQIVYSGGKLASYVILRVIFLFFSLVSKLNLGMNRARFHCFGNRS